MGFFILDICFCVVCLVFGRIRIKVVVLLSGSIVLGSFLEFVGVLRVFFFGFRTCFMFLFL